METAIARFFKEVEVNGKIPRFVCDTRILKKGDVFVAYKGEKTDGHLFIQEALNKGASLVIAKEGSGPKIFQVPDPFNWIQACAIFRLQSIAPKVIGVTGSYGKTTTKGFLKTLLDEKYNVFASEGNFNSQIGLPLTLMSLPKECEIAILEMGMTEEGQIRKRVEWTRPEIALISSIGLCHAEFFPEGLKGIARAKGEILQTVHSAFYNERTREFEPFKSFKKGHVCFTSGIIETPDGFIFDVEGVKLGPFITSIDAPYLLENLHLAIACAISLGLSEEQLRQGISKLSLEAHRLEIKHHQGKVFIDDAYNASPSSMQAAIGYLKKQKAQRKIAVLGSMKELGVFSKEEHEKIGSLLEGIDQVFCIGEETRPIVNANPEKAFHFTELESLHEELQKVLQEGDCVLFKGSHSICLDTLVEKLISE